MIYLKISDCVHARKGRIESFEKMSRERKIKRKSMCMEKKEKKEEKNHMKEEK
jgi:hypothetical protein